MPKKVFQFHLPALKCTTKISFFKIIPGPVVEGAGPQRKPAWKKGQPVPVPCECLTPSGEIENAGPCPLALWQSFQISPSTEHSQNVPHHWTKGKVFVGQTNGP